MPLPEWSFSPLFLQILNLQGFGTQVPLQTIAPQSLVLFFDSHFMYVDNPLKLDYVDSPSKEV